MFGDYPAGGGWRFWAFIARTIVLGLVGLALMFRVMGRSPGGGGFA